MKYEFFLGAADSEMQEVKKVVEQAGCMVNFTTEMGWGDAKASTYQERLEEIRLNNSYACAEGAAVPDSITKALISGELQIIIPVLVELSIDCELPQYSITVDHHNDRAGEAPSIIQVCNLLGITPTREQNLIGAFDAAYAYGLVAIGASSQELSEFFADADSSMSIGQMLLAREKESDITKEAQRAVDNADMVDDLFIIRCAHSTCGPITARVFDKQTTQNILIISDNGEINYYGDGEKSKHLFDSIIVNDSNDKWAGGAGLCESTQETIEYWTQYGGYIPDTAFFGCKGVKSGSILKELLSIS